MYWNREGQKILGLWESVGFANIGEENLRNSKGVLRERLSSCWRLVMKKERRTGTAKEEKYWPNIWNDTLAEAKVIFLSMQKATNIFKISGPLKPEPSLIQRWVLH